MANYRNKKIRNHARGQDCTMNSHVCNYDPATVIFCHLNESFAGKGMRIKAHDFAGFFGCSDCHSLYDSKKLNDHWLVLRAVMKTMKILFRDGIIK